MQMIFLDFKSQFLGLLSDGRGGDAILPHPSPPQELATPVSLRLGHDTALDARRKRLHPFTTASPLRYPAGKARALCFFIIKNL